MDSVFVVWGGTEDYGSWASVVGSSLRPPPSHSSLHPPLPVFSPFSLGCCCNIKDINTIFFYLGHTAEGSTLSKHTAQGCCCYSVLNISVMGYVNEKLQLDGGCSEMGDHETIEGL